MSVTAKTINMLLHPRTIVVSEYENFISHIYMTKFARSSVKTVPKKAFKTARFLELEVMLKDNILSE